MRLIDADELKKQFTINANGERISEYDCDNFPITVQIREVKQMIRMSPTIEQGSCDGCVYKGIRHQKCVCCKRNRYLKDCYRGER